MKKEEADCDLVDESESNAKDSKFNCLKCGNNYSSARSLKRHDQSVHAKDERARRSQKMKPEPKTDEEDNNKTISCNECTERFTTNEEYLRHKIVHKKSFECDVSQNLKFDFSDNSRNILFFSGMSEGIPI